MSIVLFFIEFTLFFFIARKNFSEFNQRFNTHINEVILSCLPNLNENLISKSNVQDKKVDLTLYNCSFLLLLVCLIVLFCFFKQDYISVAVVSCFLLHFSFLDAYYRLIDLDWVIMLFFLLLSYKIYEVFQYGNENWLFISILSFWIMGLFSILITIIGNVIFRKTLIGQGDLFLLCTLAILFEPKMLILLLGFSSLLGLVFVLFQSLFLKRKYNSIPFVPFISLSTIICFFVKLPPTYF